MVYPEGIYPEGICKFLVPPAHRPRPRLTTPSGMKRKSSIGSVRPVRIITNKQTKSRPYEAIHIGARTLHLQVHAAESGRSRGDSTARGDELTVPEPARSIDTEVGQPAIGALSSDSTFNLPGACAETASTPTTFRFFSAVLLQSFGFRPSPSFHTSPIVCSLAGADQSFSV